MSNIPTVNRPFNSPKEAFDYILNTIIPTTPSGRVTLVNPHLESFLNHPIITEIVGTGNDPAPPDVSPPINLELKQLQDSLNTLSKAVERLSKGNPPSSNPTPSKSQKQKGRDSKQQPQRAHSAVAGSRPPNPSLVVDLAHLDFPDGGRPKPEPICDALN